MKYEAQVSLFFTVLALLVRRHEASISIAVLKLHLKLRCN